MAVDVFLKLGSATWIKGESRDAKHKDEIEILSFNIGGSNPMQTGGGSGGAGTGKVSFHDFSFVMFVDKSTTKLIEHMALGKVIDTGVIVARTAGQTPVEFLKWTFSNVFVTGLSQGLASADDRGMQEVSFAYQKIRIDYTEQNEKGGAGASTFFEFDIAKNTGGGGK